MYLYIVTVNVLLRGVSDIEELKKSNFWYNYHPEIKAIFENTLEGKNLVTLVFLRDNVTRYQYA